MHRRAPILIALVLAACGSGEAASPEAPSSTVGDVGQLPAEFAVATTEPVTTDGGTVVSTVEEPTDPTEPEVDEPVEVPGGGGEHRPVGRLVDGNRLLVIGDSILASTSRRYGDDMCAELVPRGWAVEVDAESGVPIEFGQEVLDDRLDAGWDAAVIMLGNNYGGDPQAYADALTDIVDELSPRPVVLLTVTEFRPDRAEVNYVIRSLAAERYNVRAVEWAERTREGRGDGLLSGDGLHLSDTGRTALVAMTSRALGRAPVGSEGECLSTRFTDDSRGPVAGSGSPGSGSGSSGSGSGSGSGGGSGGGRGTATTVSAPATTVPAPVPTTAPPGPPATDPPPPDPPPPPTQPPPTQPPPTQPPPPATTVAITPTTAAPAP